jgi:hypothetical protein
LISSGLVFTYNDTGLTANTRYFYRVRAFNGANPPSAFVFDDTTTQAAGDGYQFPAGAEPTASTATLTAVPTFHSVSLYWPETGGTASNEALVRFRKLGTAAWRQGLSLWWDNRNEGTGAGLIPSVDGHGPKEYRGSIVQLESNTTYEIEVLTATTRKLKTTQVTTWNEVFPVGTTTNLATSSSSTLTISQSGTPGAYRLYQPAAGGSATIDGNNSIDDAVVISGSYIILRGLITKRTRNNGIRLTSTAHHIVIENCDISEFGHEDGSTNFACEPSSGITGPTSATFFGITNIVIQNNRIHHPNFDSNSWEEPARVANPSCNIAATQHPQGSSAIFFKDTGGNHVFLYNEIYSDFTHMFKDAFAGGQNFSHNGDYRRDTDIYGNIVSYSWDDGIQTEGAGMNIRVYGNYIEFTMTGVSNAPVSIGPMYVFRNVMNRGVRTPISQGGTQLGGEGWFWKTRNKSVNGTVAGINIGAGRTYLFHNTIYRTATGNGVNQTLSVDAISVVNIYSRNNIWNSNNSVSSNFMPAADSDFDYELVTAGHTRWLMEGANSIAENAIYDSGHASGTYTLSTSSAGFDSGVVIPNFNDTYSGAGPDRGAQERGAPSLVFGNR